MSFIEKIKTDMYLAMKDRIKYKSTILRSALAKLKDAESKRQVLQQVIKQTSSNKNFFILSSIISQILSLLSLLILFRNLIKSKL